MAADFDGHTVKWCRLAGADLRDVISVNVTLNGSLTPHQEVAILFSGGYNIRAAINRSRDSSLMLYVI